MSDPDGELEPRPMFTREEVLVAQGMGALVFLGIALITIGTIIQSIALIVYGVAFTFCAFLVTVFHRHLTDDSNQL